MSHDAPSTAWLKCIVSARFDLELGHVVDAVVPEGALTAEQKKQIAFVTFPDSNIQKDQEMMYMIRLIDSDNTTPLYGSVYFRQKIDSSQKRGAVQGSVTVVSYYPHIALHEAILRRVAAAYFQRCGQSPDFLVSPTTSPGCAFLEPIAEAPLPEVERGREEQTRTLVAAWQDIEAWPTAHPQSRYTLALLNFKPFIFTTPPSTRRRPGTPRLRREIRLDERVKLLDSTETASSHSFHQIQVHNLLHDKLNVLTKLWELVISGSHLLIMGSSATACSSLVAATVSLIVPLSYGGQLRPFSTVQEFGFPVLQAYGQKGRSFPVDGIIVGSANPFFPKALSLWTNVLKATDVVPTMSREGTTDFEAMSRNGSSVTSPQLPYDSGAGDSLATTPTLAPLEPTHTPETSFPAMPSNGSPDGGSRESTNPSPNTMPPSPEKNSSMVTPKGSPKLAPKPSGVGGYIGRALSSGTAKITAPIGFLRRKVAGDGPLTPIDSTTGAEPQPVKPTTSLQSKRVFALRNTDLTKELAGRLMASPTGADFAALVNNDVVRKFFVSMTNLFVQPLEIHLSEVLARTPGGVFMLYGVSHNDLKPSAFYDRLRADILPKGMFKTTKQALSLYQEFLKTQTFALWVHDTLFQWFRESAINFDISDSNVLLSAADSPINLVDMFLKLHQDALDERESEMPDIALLNALYVVLIELVSRLPSEMRSGFDPKLASIRIG